MPEIIQWSNNTCRLNKINGQFGKDIYAQLFVDQIGRDFKGRILSIGLREAFGISKINTLLPNSIIDVIDIFPADSWAIPNKVFKTHITQIATLKLKYDSEEELKKDIFTILDSIDMTKYDKIIMNPPFKLGNKICSEVLKHCKGDVICLMPLSKYKAGKLYEHVDLSSFKLVDPRLFSEATITNNLSVATLKQNSVTESYDPLEDLTLTPAFKLIYGWNRKHYQENFKFITAPMKHNATPEKHFLCHVLVANDGFMKKGYMRDWNFTGTVDVMDKRADGADYAILLPTAKAKQNLGKWAYIDVNSLANKLVAGLCKMHGSIELAIPQIDWDKIDQDEDWKAGDYDKAVLKAMGMYMDTDGYIKEIEK